MWPYLNFGSLHLGTFGLLLWLAAVVGAFVLHQNFLRNGVKADAFNVVVITTLAGIAGAKLYHELQDPAAFREGIRMVLVPGWHHPLDVIGDFFKWFQAGFAWFGGLLAGVTTLILLGATEHLNGLSGKKAAQRMLDLCTPAVAMAYGFGRLGCLTSGDGDYGKNTTLPWGVHMMQGPDSYHRALVPPTPPNAAVQPTPVYELLWGVAIGIWLWHRGSKPRPLGYLTGEYLVLSGIGRFLVEFERLNPLLYFGHTMSNAQVAALGSVVVGAVMMFATRNNEVVTPEAVRFDSDPTAGPEPVRG